VTEGWWKDSYFILFDENEIRDRTEGYGISLYLPGYEIVGLMGWDDFIVRDARQVLHLVPTVPLGPKYLRTLAAPIVREVLERDPRWEGRIKWWLKPIVFGGDPKDEGNVTWVTPMQHAQLVRWWNDQYQSMVRPGA
jgi:hypothetical protein